MNLIHENGQPEQRIQDLEGEHENGTALMTYLGWRSQCVRKPVLRLTYDQEE